MPDIFVARDTSYASRFYSAVAARGILQEFVNGYMDSRRTAMHQKYASWEELVADPAVDEVFGEFVEYCKAEGIEASQADVEKSSAALKLAMKALMARAIWDESVYYQVIYSEDADYKAALEEVLALRAR
jgi:hypothetical protein